MNEGNYKELEKTISRDYGNIAGLVVRKDGETIYENYFHDCTASSRIHVYSVTKSILSILIGIAVDKGLIKSTGRKVLDYFPDYTVKKREQAIQHITLEHLLTMTAPYKYKDSPLSYLRYFMSNNHLKFSLDRLGGKDPAGAFRYTPIIGPDLLSGILVNATGESVFDFAAKHLFTPLGITVERTIVFHNAKEQSAFDKAKDISGWAADSYGLNTGGWGLTLSASDMAKIGQLYLNGGMWEGRQIVSEEWVAESTKVHSRWEEANLAYGYLWWIVDSNEHSCAAMGDGGNVIYFNQKKNMAVSVASLFEQNAKDRIELIRNEIEPIFY